MRLMAKCATMAIALSTAAAACGGDGGFDHFITARDGKLYDGDRLFRFVSWNIPNLHNVEDNFEFLGVSPWRWPDEFEISDALESVRQMGGRVVRTYVISVRRDGGDMGENVHVYAPGEFNEEAFRTLDLVLKVAREKGIRVILPLVDNWHWWGGVRQYEAFRGKPEGEFWTDPEIRKDFFKTVEFVVNRRNTLTGDLYRDDKTILGWETGNELDSPPEWTSAVAAYLKQLDSQHLVIDGRSLKGIPTGNLDDPNVDVVTTHHYPNSGNNTADSVAEAAQVIAGRKAYFVGEFGFLPIEEAQRFLDITIDEGVSGALFWSLRFRRREGGFYWHHEPSGGNLFKAFHWPGSAEGDGYRERDVMAMIRDAAYRIQGRALPPLPTPAAPRLLEPPGSGLLSWRGAAGAVDYSVERATTSGGPWTVIAEGVNEAATQYRPVFADETAMPGVEHYYRVVARNNAGASPPSNIVGPVVNNTRLLLDEMADLSRLESHTGGVEARSGDDRKTQEDIHRLAMAPGSSATYRVDGAVRSVRLWAFVDNTRQPIEMAVSGGGEQFELVAMERETTPDRAADYYYLRPLLLTASIEGDNAGLLRIAIPSGDDSAGTQLSRIEIRYDANE